MNSVCDDTFTYTKPIAQITILHPSFTKVIMNSVKLSKLLFPCGLIDKGGSTFKAYLCVHYNYWTMILNCETATLQAKLE